MIWRGSGGSNPSLNQAFFLINSVLFKKACERRGIHNLSKSRLRKKMRCVITS